VVDRFQRRALLPALYRLIALSTIILLIGGGVALLWQYQQSGQQAAHASDVGVVGAPTLSASTVNAIFSRVGSPMNGTGQLVETVSRQTGIDDAFALGVWWAESNDGMAGVGLSNRNPGSVRGSIGYPSDGDGYTIYPSYSAAVSYWFNLLRSRYVDQGLSTVYTIARPYVGTASYPLWAAKVINLMFEYRGIAPPPSAFVPTATPKPKPTVNPAFVAANVARHRKAALIQQWQSHTGSFAYLFNQGLSRETTRQPAASGSPLSLHLVDFIILLGLLAALAIALYALLGLRKASVSHAQSSETFQGIPQTEPLSMASPIREPVFTLPSRNPVTDALPRRVRLLPVQESQHVPVTVGAEEHPAGLLSRYGQIDKNTDM
jgi:hypothetical protein